MENGKELMEGERSLGEKWTLQGLKQERICTDNDRQEAARRKFTANWFLIGIIGEIA